jgi:AAA15 family ATPase/GTPase
MKLSQINIKGHPILGDIKLSLVNPKTKEPYSVVAFVGENGCGKTTLLTELFQYENSDFIVDKEHPYNLVAGKKIDALFLRQDSLFTNAMNDVYKLITGKELLESRGETPTGGLNVYASRLGVPVNTPVQAEPILELLQDERLKRLFMSGDIEKISCGGEVSRSISGKKPELDFSMLSSGQIEILLKLRELKKLRAGTDFVLLDEPETSLHPRWQQVVVGLISEMIGTNENTDLQLFVATHSERVLESLIGKGDTLIVRLYRKNGKIKAEPVDLMGLLLPKPTFAELDYVIFGMCSYDYHDQLLMRYADLIDEEVILKLDKAIRSDKHFLRREHWKESSHEAFGKRTDYKTLPIYIRNWFHHSNGVGKEPTKEELNRSIDLLRALVQDQSPVS